MGVNGLQFCKLLTEAVNTEHFKRNSKQSLVKCEVIKIYNNLFCGFIPLLSPTQFVFAYCCSSAVLGSQVPLEFSITLCSYIYS